MSKKKETVWHKKKGKFIPATYLKPHGAQPASSSPASSQNRGKEFAARLVRQIKKAAAEGS